MNERNRFPIPSYFSTLARLWFSPVRFFSEQPEVPRIERPFGFLLISSIIVAAGSLFTIPDRLVLKGAIVFLNAVAMPLVASAFGYLVMTMMMGKRAGYLRLFSVYAFSSGATLPLAWLPFSLWFIETWKWVLIGIGMVKGCAFRPFQAAAVIALSAMILFFFFWSLGPMILWFKGGGG